MNINRATQVKLALEALELILTNQTDIDNAFIAPNIGLISLKYGRPGDDTKNYKGGYGISHIIAKRDSELGCGYGLRTMKALLKTLIYGDIIKVVPAKQTIHVRKEDMR